MELTPSRIPVVPQKVRRQLGPPPDPDEKVALPPALEALLAHRHAARLERAEKRSLHPVYLAEVHRQFEAERAVEENLARGRARIRYEIRRATDMARAGLDRHRVHFPSVSCTACEIFRPLLYGIALLFSPFALYFAFIALMML